MKYVVVYQTINGRRLYYTGKSFEEPGLLYGGYWTWLAREARLYDRDVDAEAVILGNRTVCGSCQVGVLTDADIHTARLGDNAV